MKNAMTTGLATIGGAAGMAVAMLAMGAAMGGSAALADDHTHAMGASLFGENAVGHDGAGDDAGGDFTGMIDMEAGTLCYYLETYGLEDVTAAHIHKGKKDKNGPPVVTLMANEDDETCVEVDSEVLADIAKNEESYYVNVHTQAIPEGAVRGQLGT